MLPNPDPKLGSLKGLVTDTFPTSHIRSLVDTADSFPKPRSLGELTTDQNAVIESLVCDKHLFQEPRDSQWLRLWHSIWELQTEQVSDQYQKVVRSPSSGAIDDQFLLPDNVPSSHYVMTLPIPQDIPWNLNCHKILIRSEYYKAEEFILSACGDKNVEALIITGQPGIGKSIFLFRTLLRRLKFRLVTVLQHESDSALIFYEGGVKTFSPSALVNGLCLRGLQSESGPAGRIWALVNSSQDLKAPGSLFQSGPFFTIVASSPDPDYFKWIVKVPHTFFYMESWSLVEVIQVRSFIRPDLEEKRLFKMHNKYGASIRGIFKFAPIERAYENVVNGQIYLLSIGVLENLLESPYSSENTSLIISTHPSPTDRTGFDKGVTSQYVLGKIFTGVLRSKVDLMAKFYLGVQGLLHAEAFARALFKFRVCQIFTEGGTFDLFPICHSGADAKYFLYNDYSATNTRAPLERLTLTECEESVAPEVNTCYRPWVDDFPSLGSWFSVRTTNTHDSSISLGFRIALGQTHAVEWRDLDKLDEVISPARKKHMIVVTNGMQPTIAVPKDYLEGKLGGCAHDEAFPVYHLPLAKEELFPQFHFPGL